MDNYILITEELTGAFIGMLKVHIEDINSVKDIIVKCVSKENTMSCVKWEDFLLNELEKNGINDAEFIYPEFSVEVS